MFSLFSRSRFFFFLMMLIRYNPEQFAGAFVISWMSSWIAGVSLLSVIPILNLSGFSVHSGVSQPLPAFLKWMSFNHIALSLPTALMVFVICISLFALFNGWAGILIFRFYQEFLLDLQQRFMTLMSRTQWTYLVDSKQSDIQHMVSVGLPQISNLTMSFVTVCSDVLTLLVLIFISALLSPALTLCAFGLLGVIFAASLAFRFISEVGGSHLKVSRHFHEHLNQFLEGLKLSKCYNFTSEYLRQFCQITKDYTQVTVDYFLFYTKRRTVFYIFSAVMIAGLFYTGLLIFKVPIHHLIVLLVLFSRLFPRFLSLQQSFVKLSQLYPYLDAFLEMQNGFLSAQEPQSQPISVSFTRGLSVKHIGVRYQGHYALNDVTFTFPCNQTTAIVGRSGAGKTTLVDVILGVLSVESGEIWVDDLCLAPEMMESWRTHIAYVPQEPFFFNGTLRENLIWSNLSVTDEEIWRVLTLVSADAFVLACPDGLETPIGNRGLKLSGGQRQRLALARALLRSPRLLILDEATSALDDHHESIIYQMLEKLHGMLTIILIAHRLGTISSADQVLVLDQGCVVESGSFQQLRSNSASKFMALFSIQAARCDVSV
jgi:ATP-binding cassette subfamily C protein